MRRREFIKVLGGAVASWPSAAWAQGSQKIPRVSVLIGLVENDRPLLARNVPSGVAGRFVLFDFQQQPLCEKPEIAGH